MLPKASLEKGKYDLTIEYTINGEECLMKKAITL
jgi:hypothetical protein